MTIEEVFSKVDARKIKGMMFHQQMADYFNFLNLEGYKTIHIYRYLEESKELEELHDFYIQEYCKLMIQNRVEDPEVIPENWYKYYRSDVDRQNKEKFIVSAFQKWSDWERETRDIYNEACTECVKNGDISAFRYMNDCLLGVVDELRIANKLYLSINSVSGDLDYVLNEQESLKEYYLNMCSGI